MELKSQNYPWWWFSWTAFTWSRTLIRFWFSFWWQESVSKFQKGVVLLTTGKVRLTLIEDYFASTVDYLISIFFSLQIYIFISVFKCNTCVPAFYYIIVYFHECILIVNTNTLYRYRHYKLINYKWPVYFESHVRC